MPRVINQKKLIEACRLHFYGESFADIAILLDIHPNTLTRWRKTDTWKDYEAKLIDEWEEQQKKKSQ